MEKNISWASGPGFELATVRNSDAIKELLDERAKPLRQPAVTRV